MNVRMDYSESDLFLSALMRSHIRLGQAVTTIEEQRHKLFPLDNHFTLTDSIEWGA
jgi:hypothetical protein